VSHPSAGPCVDASVTQPRLAMTPADGQACPPRCRQCRAGEGGLAARWLGRFRSAAHLKPVRTTPLRESSHHLSNSSRLQSVGWGGGGGGLVSCATQLFQPRPSPEARLKHAGRCKHDAWPVILHRGRSHSLLQRHRGHTRNRTGTAATLATAEAAWPHSQPHRQRGHTCNRRGTAATLATAEAAWPHSQPQRQRGHTCNRRGTAATLATAQAPRPHSQPYRHRGHTRNRTGTVFRWGAMACDGHALSPETIVRQPPARGGRPTGCGPSPASRPAHMRASHHTIPSPPPSLPHPPSRTCRRAFMCATNVR